MKAADADTVGGKPLSAFVLYEDLEKAAGKNIPVATIVMQNGASLAHSGVSGTGETASSHKGQGAEKLQLSGGITPVAYNEIGSNTWFGEGAGASITTGTDNSFFGSSAGFSNTTGNANSFFGYNAGWWNNGVNNDFFGYAAGGANTTGSFNSFFGCHAGDHNISGDENSFFGNQAGESNTTGYRNAFFGIRAGDNNGAGFSNTFLGAEAGSFNTAGSYNSFFGFNAGRTNSTEGGNTFIGVLSDGAAGVFNATAIGCRAQVTQSSSLVLGSIKGVNGAPEDTNVGIGTTAPSGRLHIKGGVNELLYVGVSGDIGIGTITPDKRVQVISTATKNATLHLGGTGDAAKDIFAGMGEDVDSGPAFNYGYAGYSFGRSAGFLNVRPDPSAVAPNPSLRFMTANQQRMIITNAGRVGIGTTSPQTTLHVQGESVYVGAPGEGIILKSPDGLMCVKLTVSNTGALVSTPLACP